MEFREVPSKAKLMDSPCQQEGEEQESSFASLVLEGSLTEPTSRAESIVDPEGSFIDDSISDHINLSGENYGENDECSNRPATRRSDFDCDSFETFDSEGDEIKDEAVGTGRRKTIIDIEQGNIQYETNVTACWLLQASGLGRLKSLDLFVAFIAVLDVSIFWYLIREDASKWLKESILSVWYQSQFGNMAIVHLNLCA